MRLGNDRIELQIAPAFGARVTSLTDRRTGRQWLAQGDLVGSQEDTAVYRGLPSRGWDECFPTVASCDDAGWGGPLRDHCALWGRPWACSQTSTGILAQYRDHAFVFSRALSLSGSTVLARYTLESKSDQSLPWLWSQHCLLACEPGEEVSATGLSPWRGSDGAVGQVGPVLGSDAGVAYKFHAQADGPVSVSVAGSKGGLRFRWSPEICRFAGLWLNYGGWPPESPNYQIAIEPTTAPVDCLATAHATGAVNWLRPYETCEWDVTVELFSVE